MSILVIKKVDISIEIKRNDLGRLRHHCNLMIEISGGAGSQWSLRPGGA